MKEPTLHAVLFVLKGLLKCICKFISMICLIYQISKQGGFCREKLDHRVKKELRMCVFVCVGGECVLTIFYRPQASMRKCLELLRPQINITEQCESLCKRQIIFENPLEPTLSFDNGTEMSIIYIIF